MRFIKKIISNPRKIFVYMGSHGFLNWLPDKLYLKLIFKSIMGYSLDFNNPKTFSQKLQWLKVYNRNPLYTSLVDKYEVKTYIEKLIGQQYIIPNYGVYNSFEEIDFEKLPQQFVLKCTHDSGGLVICTNKDELDLEYAKKKINKSLKRRYFYWGREWPYKNVKPRIICEKYISNTNIAPDDYKVLCFNGEAKLIELHRGRYTNHTQDFYDTEWNKTDISQSNTSNVIYGKPEKLEQMLSLSQVIAKDIPHVRIDWFIVNEQLYFGEVTFFDGSGMEPFDNIEHDYLLGSWIHLEGI